MERNGGEQMIPVQSITLPRHLRRSRNLNLNLSSKLQRPVLSHQLEVL